MTKSIYKTVNKLKALTQYLTPKTLLSSAATILFIVAFLAIKASPMVGAAACTIPPTNYGTDTIPKTGAAALTAPSSTYTIWVDMETPTPSDNSVMLQVNGNTCFNVGGSSLTANTPTWVDYQNGSSAQTMQVSTTTGSDQTLEFIGTEPGVEIGDILLLTNSSCVPTGTGSNCTTGQPAPTTPTNVTATVNGENSITVKWTGSSPGGPGLGVGGYYIYRNGSTTPLTTINSASTTSYTDTTVSGGQSYTYQVQAFDTGSPVTDSAMSTASAPVSTPSAPPSPPSTVQVTSNTATSVSLSWPAASDSNGPGIASYNVLRNGSQIGTVSGSSSTNTYTDSTATENQTYNYCIQSVDKDGNKSTTNTCVSDITPKYPNPIAPTNVVESAGSSTSVTVSWSEANPADPGGPGLAGYNIYRTSCNGNSSTSTLIGGATTASYTDTTTSPKCTYTYSVASYDSATPADVSTITAAANSVTTPSYPLPASPSSVKASATSPTSVSVSWVEPTNSDPSGPGLAGFYIVRTGGQGGTVTFTDNSPSATSYTDTTAAANTTYTYGVEAFDKNTPNPDVSSPTTINVTTPAYPTPIAPTSVSATATAYDSVSISWKGGSDPTGGPGLGGYAIIRTIDGVSQPLTQVSGTVTSYTDNSVLPDTTYTYSVETLDSATPPDASPATSASPVTTPNQPNETPPSAPADLVATAANNSQINLSWNASTDTGGAVAGYTIYRCTNSETCTDGTSIATDVTSTTYGDTGLSSKTLYSYYVVAYNSGGKDSADSNVAYATTKGGSHQSGIATVEGTVTSATTNADISGVFVHTGIHGTSAGEATAYTNGNGQYALDNLIANRGHIFSYTDSGYKGKEFTKSFPVGTSTQNISLTPKTTKKA